MTRPENWVFLGDSLTEGVGSSPVSYVTELTALLRAREAAKPAAERREIHEFRLRQIEGGALSRFTRFNAAGFWKKDEPGSGRPLWIWNLACEGRMVDTDAEWLPFIENLDPERIFFLRGGLESIVRPAAFHRGDWPCWVPRGWRGYAAMDPRCYFSSTWWRQLKQRLVDHLKQRVRRALLAREPGAPLMAPDVIEGHLSGLIRKLSRSQRRLCLLGLLPVGEAAFPGSPAQFDRVRRMQADLAARTGTEFFQPLGTDGRSLDDPKLYYLDLFHPNAEGSRRIAESILAHLDTD